MGELASASLDGETALKELLKERTASSPSRITNDLIKEVTDADVDKLMVACYNDVELCQRIKPYYHFLRFDAWGNPLLYPKGAYMLTTGSDRRETGSHYTPKSLTESIVTETLEPVVYIGPAEGKPREEWQLKPPEELLNLKICDPAMGSGAFLVQVCRWLAERVCESWLIAEQSGSCITAKGATASNEAEELIPNDAEERLLLAKRLISERCLYGVDINPLAVELAKLSIWLVTLSKDRPFGFLDHNLKSGDSLLGIHNLDQLCYLNLNPRQIKKSNLVEQPFTKQIKELVVDTLELRKQITSHEMNLVSDIGEMSLLEQKVKEKLILPKLIADALIGFTLESGGKLKDISVLSSLIQRAIEGDEESINILRRLAIKGLHTDLSEKNKTRKSFHWNLEFPEVFSSTGGFDAIVGNPPFIGGQKISGTLGASYREYLVSHIANGERASCDLVAYIFRRVFELLGKNSPMGLIAVNTIAEGETRQIGLDNILARQGVIYSAHPGDIWPGTANVVTSRVLIWKGGWHGKLLIGDRKVVHISTSLTERETLDIQKLNASQGLVFQGVIVLGDGFVLHHTQEELIKNSKFVYPYLIGQEVNSDPLHSPKRYSINFWDKEEREAQEDELAFSYLENTVKQERQKNKRKVYKEKWWQYAEKRPAMFHAIGKGSFFNKHPKGWTKDNFLEKVIVFATQATKYPCFTFVPNEYIYANSLCVIASDSMSLFACLSSDIHAVWAWEHGSRMKQDLRYTHGDVFETFPFPENVLEGRHKGLNQLGKEFFDLRAAYMVSNNKGMTKFYNDLHDPTIDTLEIRELREKQIELNNSVLAAYQFDDLEPDYGFHQVGYLPKRKNIRFSISEEAREEILYRLAMLNKTRHEAEQE